MNKIVLKVFAHNGNIIPESFYRTIYHELNHNRDGGVRPENVDYDTIQDLIKSDNKIENAFGSLVYRLLIPTEFRAFVAGLYGDLKNFNRKESFRFVLHKTSSYRDYSYLKDVYVPLLEKQPKEIWNNLMPYYNLGDIDPGEYKNKFLTLVRNKLAELFKRWGKVGTLYMDERIAEGITVELSDIDKVLSLMKRINII